MTDQAEKKKQELLQILKIFIFISPDHTDQLSIKMSNLHNFLIDEQKQTENFYSYKTVPSLLSCSIFWVAYALMEIYAW